jgi:hypothetical protein
MHLIVNQARNHLSLFLNYRGEKIVKLNLFFIIMDLLTLLAYPFVSMYGRLRQFSKARNVLVIGSVGPGR